MRLLKCFVLEKVEITLLSGGTWSLKLLILVMSSEILAGRMLCHWVCDLEKRKLRVPMRFVPLRQERGDEGHLLPSVVVK